MCCVVVADGAAGGSDGIFGRHIGSNPRGPPSGRCRRKLGHGIGWALWLAVKDCKTLLLFSGRALPRILASDSQAVVRRYAGCRGPRRVRPQLHWRQSPCGPMLRWQASSDRGMKRDEGLSCDAMNAALYEGSSRRGQALRYPTPVTKPIQIQPKASAIPRPDIFPTSPVCLYRHCSAFWAVGNGVRRSLQRREFRADWRREIGGVERATVDSLAFPRPDQVVQHGTGVPGSTHATCVSHPCRQCS